MSCQIFTDVDGSYVILRSRLIGDAKKSTKFLRRVAEMAGAGSKVMQSRAVEFAKKFLFRLRFAPAFTMPLERWRKRRRPIWKMSFVMRSQHRP